MNENLRELLTKFSEYPKLQAIRAKSPRVFLGAIHEEFLRGNLASCQNYALKSNFENIFAWLNWEVKVYIFRSGNLSSCWNILRGL